MNRSKPADSSKRQAKLRSEIEHLTDAIAAGALKSSPAIAARLAQAEQELAQLEAAASVPPAKALPGFADKYRAAVTELETVMSPAGTATDEEIARARTRLRDYLGGGIVVTETDKEIRFETESSTEEMALRLAGSGSQVFMVAGAGFEPATFGL